VAHSITLKK